MSLNKLQDYIVTDLELAYTIARKRADFDTYYKFQKWAVGYLKANVRGHMPTKAAQRHLDWIEFYIVPRPKLWENAKPPIEEEFDSESLRSDISPSRIKEYLTTTKYTRIEESNL